MEALGKLLFYFAFMFNDGQVEAKIKEVHHCPPYEVVQKIAEHKMQDPKVLGWSAGCSEVMFLVKPSVSIERFSPSRHRSKDLQSLLADEYLEE